MSTKLVWVTPKAEALIAEIGRVSNPDNQSNPSYEKLLTYLVKNKHWSPFEMANACIEINTTRDIGRQILRHRSFSFQEFSQRYADVSKLPPAELRECRLQDVKNRQNSLPTEDALKALYWEGLQKTVSALSLEAYNDALSVGIAKEQARALLPEGLTSSRMYMSGNIRSWMHYIQIRTEAGTQKEHREIALACKEILMVELPNVFKALES